jgi:hypothetical protein
MKTVGKRVFMGWVNTKPQHPEDHYKSSASRNPGVDWVRVYAHVAETNTTVDYAATYKLCKAITNHIEMTINGTEKGDPAHTKLVQEINADIVRLKLLLNK